MTAEEALRSILLNDAAIQTFASGRIYGIIRPPGTKEQIPCITIARTQTIRAQLTCATDRLVQAIFNIDALGYDAEEAQAGGAAIRDTLNYYSGSESGLTIQRCFVETEVPLIEADPGLVRWSQSFSVWYEED